MINRNRAWAIFGQMLFPIGDFNRLEVSLRLDHDRRRQTYLIGADIYQREKSFSAWQPKLTWSHDFTDTQMGYVTAGRGFRSGGFNAGGSDQFKPRVEIMGLESELNWRVQPGWEVFATLGLLDSEIKKVGAISTPLPITTGKRAPRTSPYNAVLGSQWNFPVGEYRAMFRFDVSRNGTKTWEADNLYLMDPVTLVNTRLTFFSNSKWNLTAWATNLFNHHYYADFSSNAFGGLGRDIGFPAPGRRFGLDFRYDF